MMRIPDRYEKQEELLNELSLGKEYFFSERILLQVVDRCRWILSETDRILGADGTPSHLRAQFEEFSFVERTFFVRSTPARYEIERLGKNFKDPVLLKHFAKEMESSFDRLVRPAVHEKKSPRARISSSIAIPL